MRKFLLLSVIAMLVTVQLWAQRAITGRVTDRQGNPLTGVSVQVKGSNVGVTTGEDGRFTLTVPSNARTLVFSSVDRSTQEVSLGNQSNFDISLEATDKSLQEVVVVGYGTQRRREATGNVSSVRGESIAQKPVQSFESGLAGKAAGVQITMPNGVLNSPPVFRIRGVNSLSLSTYPLIVVDGVPTYSENQNNLNTTSSPANPLASINPNDIESIDIAKDAAAAAIYGSRAANGVVFITTKKGRTGKARVNYDGWAGWNKPMRMPDVLDANQYVAYKNVALDNLKAITPTTTGNFIIPTDAQGNPINTNWYDYIYRTGFSHSHNVNVSGGTEGTNYYFSAGYTDQEGVIQKNSFERINALLNIDSRLNSWISIGGKLSYSNERNKIPASSGSLPNEAFASAGVGRLAFALPPNISPFLNDGKYNYASGSAIGSMGTLVNGANPYTFWNAKMLIDLNRSNNEVNHLQSNAYIQVKPFKWFTFRSVYGIDNLFLDSDIFSNPFHGDGALSGAAINSGPGGAAGASFTKEKLWLWTNTAQFDYTLNDKHNFSLLAGNEQNRQTTTGFGIGRKTLSDSAYTNVQSGFTVNNTFDLDLGENYLLSYFGRLNYNFNNKYLFSANVRQDEYSALGVKKGTFWGASVGWEIAREDFWDKAGLDRVFSSFKLRGSYGKVGNVGGIGNFAAFSNYGSGLYGGIATLGFTAVGNDQITWETSKKTDVGFSFGILNERVTGDVAFYKNDIDNLLLAVPQAPSAGLPNNILQNVGTMVNKGVEFSLNGALVRAKDFSWNSSFNYAFNKNEVTALANGLNEILTATQLETVNKTTVGQPAGQLWVVRTGGVDPATGKRIFINKAGNPVLYQFGSYPAASGQFNWMTPDGKRYEKVNPDGSITPLTINWADDAVAYGNPHPRHLGGWDNTFRYKGFDLNVLLTYQLGFSIYYGSNAGLHDQRFWNNDVNVLTHWQKPGDITSIPKPIFGDNVSNGSSMPLDINVFKGDFVKLRTLQFGYTIPKNLLSKARMSNARVYVAGQNLAIFTKYPGPDPEVSSNGNTATGAGVDRNTVVNGRTITVGININL